ncbi:hypothetical protein Nmel_008602 [Mimus melanotis]
MVNKAIITSVEAKIPSRLLQGTVTEVFPLTSPGWEPNVPEQMARLKQYQNLMVYGLKHGVPKALNWSKLHKVE